MDTAGMKEALNHLETWRQNLERFGVLVPALQALFRLVEEGPAEVARLEKRKTQLQQEIETLGQQHERDTQRARAARAEADAQEERLRAVQRDYDEFKAKFRTPATV